MYALYFICPSLPVLFQRMYSASRVVYNRGEHFISGHYFYYYSSELGDNHPGFHEIASFIVSCMRAESTRAFVSVSDYRCPPCLVDRVSHVQLIIKTIGSYDCTERVHAI